MDIISIFRRKARIVADVEERTVPADTNNDLHLPSCATWLRTTTKTESTSA